MKAKTILPAKITRPIVSNIYLRKRLFKQLDTERKSKGIYVCGPPGAGKTTLINSYIESRTLSSLWYRVDEGDTDLSTFFHYLSLAEKWLNPKKKKPLPNLTPEYKLGINTFARRYFEELFSRMKSPFSLVLDNFQDASSESKFHEIVNIALNEVPEGCKIIIISRTTPPSAFSRSIANKDIKTIGWDDLQLTEDETMGIVRLLGYKESVCNTLNTQFCKCRGWIAGLLLLLERAEKNMIERQGVNKIAGESSFNYFMSEIFEKLDDRTKDFLLKTSFLPAMTLPMTINLSENEKGGEILTELSKRHFFTEKSGGAAVDTYHYHPLFREFLLSSAGKSFTKEHINELRIKAGYLLLDTGDIDNAVELFKEAGYYKGLNRVIIKNAPELIKEGRRYPRRGN
ncbi:MAG: hypothetical protein HY096_06190 [Nitrospinae bacterium]|nr:hypothetical protein [Nitrospinota bacterium]